MTDQLFPKNVSEASQERIKELAASVYNKDIEGLSKEEIQQVVALDMSTFPTKLTVGAMATRTLEAKFNTNNYSASMEIDVSGMNATVNESLSSVEDKGKMLESYLSAKSAAFALIKIKYEGTESYLRDLLQSACEKDGTAKVGRHSR